MERLQADATLKTSYFCIKKNPKHHHQQQQKKQKRKTEGEALPSPLHFKDHFPNVGAAVIAFAGCTAPWSGHLTPCPTSRPGSSPPAFQSTPSFEHPKFNHPRRAREVWQHLGNTWAGTLRTGWHHPAARLGHGEPEVAGGPPAPPHTGHITLPFLTLPTTNGEQNKRIQASEESL